MVYTVGEMANLLGVAASTLRYYDKMGLLPFVERSGSGIRMFRDSDIGWLKIIGCMKKAGMPLKDIRSFIQLSIDGDDTIALRLEMFRKQRDSLQAQIDELQHTMEMVEYKCWYYETALAAGTTQVPAEMNLAEIPERFRGIRRELQSSTKP